MQKPKRKNLRPAAKTIRRVQQKLVRLAQKTRTAIEKNGPHQKIIGRGIRPAREDTLRKGAPLETTYHHWHNKESYHNRDRRCSKRRPKYNNYNNEERDRGNSRPCSIPKKNMRFPAKEQKGQGRGGGGRGGRCGGRGDARNGYKRGATYPCGKQGELHRRHDPSRISLTANQHGLPRPLPGNSHALRNPPPSGVRSEVLHLTRPSY